MNVVHVQVLVAWLPSAGGGSQSRWSSPTNLLLAMIARWALLVLFTECVLACVALRLLCTASDTA